MELYKYITKRNIIITVCLFVILCLSLVMYDKLYFRLKDTTPSLDKVATSSVEIRYHFSQPIKSIGEVVINGETIYTATITDSTITVPLETRLEEDTEYTIELKSIKSNWLNNQIDSLKRTFIPRYVNYDDLSEEEKRMQVSASNSGQVDDLFISKNVFPIFNDRWQIDATTVEDSRSIVLNVTFFAEVPDYDNGGVVTQIPDELADQYEKEVHNEIKKRGGKVEDYTIIYENKHLREEHEGHTH